MIYIDLIILAILVYSFIKGFSNGLVNEIASFLGLLIGSIISYSYSDKLSGIINNYLDIDPKLLNILSFILLFIITSFLFTIAGKSLTKFIKYISLSTMNRFLGGLFSSLKFLIIIVSVFVVVNYFSELLDLHLIPDDKSYESKLYPIIVKFGDFFIEVLNNKSLII